MILQASLSKDTNATGLFPELMFVSHSQYLSGMLSNYESRGDCAARCRPRHNRSIRDTKVTERANGWRSKTEVVHDSHILSPQRREKRVQLSFAVSRSVESGVD